MTGLVFGGFSMWSMVSTGSAHSSHTPSLFTLTHAVAADAMDPLATVQPPPVLPSEHVVCVCGPWCVWVMVCVGHGTFHVLKQQ